MIQFDLRIFFQGVVQFNHQQLEKHRQVLTTSWLQGRKPRDLSAEEKLRLVNLAALGTRKNQTSPACHSYGVGWTTTIQADDLMSLFSKKQTKLIHPQKHLKKLIWNMKMMVSKRNLLYQGSPPSGSMLVFGGVKSTKNLPCSIEAVPLPVLSPCFGNG